MAQHTSFNDLFVELWIEVASYLNPQDFWRQLGVNRSARDAVVSLVARRESLRQGQALAFLKIAHHLFSTSKPRCGP